MDVEKHQTGEVCYRGAEGEGMPKMYSFYGEKIAGEPDSKVSEWEGGERLISVIGGHSGELGEE